MNWLVIIDVKLFPSLKPVVLTGTRPTFKHIRLEKSLFCRLISGGTLFRSRIRHMQLFLVGVQWCQDWHEFGCQRSFTQRCFRRIYFRLFFASAHFQTGCTLWHLRWLLCLCVKNKRFKKNIYWTKIFSKTFFFYFMKIINCPIYT